MLRKVIIESPGGTWVRCSDVGYGGSMPYFTAEIQSCSLSDFKEIGLLSGLLERVETGWEIEGSCWALCELVRNVLDYDDAELADAQGNLEGAGFEVLLPFEIAYLDLEAREALADEARSVDNPFDQKSDGVDRVVESFFAHKKAQGE